MLVGGQFANIGSGGSANLARLRPNGTLDPEFFPPGPNGAVFALSLLLDGEILIGGQFTMVGANPALRLARLLGNGTFDGNFSADADGTVTGISPQTDGRLVVAGNFGNIASVARDFVAQLDEDGAADPDFAPAPNGQITSLTVDADGSVLIGGFFTSVDAVTRRSAARLLNDPATQTLTVPSRNRAEWLRGGASPETHEVVFELSTDGGATFTALGDGSRIAGGWERTGLSLPDSGIVRARARVRGGLGNGSGGWVSSSRLFAFTPVPRPSPPRLTIRGKTRLNTSKPRVTIRGTASDPDGNLSSVRYIDSRAKGRRFRPVRGLASWSAVALLKNGRNTVSVVARDRGGLSSPVRKVIIVRKSKGKR